MQQRSVGGEKDVGVIALSPRKRPCHSAPVKRPAERRNLSRNRLAPAKAHDTRSRARRTSETRVERLGETAGVYKPPRPLRPPLFPSQRLALNCSRLPPAQHVLDGGRGSGFDWQGLGGEFPVNCAPACGAVSDSPQGLSAVSESCPAITQSLTSEAHTAA